MNSQLAILEWVCSRCGSAGATPQGGMLQFDERYQTGYCDTCNPPSSDRKTPRPVQRLIRADSFNREAWAAKRERDELSRLVQYIAGSATVKMKDTEVVRLVELFDRHGSPGFVLPESYREIVAEYNGKVDRREQFKKKAKRRR